MRTEPNRRSNQQIINLKAFGTARYSFPEYIPANVFSQSTNSEICVLLLGAGQKESLGEIHTRFQGREGRAKEGLQTNTKLFFIDDYDFHMAGNLVIS
jgi:hypothetical protein